MDSQRWRWARGPAAAGAVVVVAALLVALLTPAFAVTTRAQDAAQTAEAAGGEAQETVEGAVEGQAEQPEPTTVAEQQQQAGQAQVRVLHASPDAGNVTVLVDGQPLAEGIAFASTTEYAPVPAGERQVQVVPAAGGDPVVDETVEFGDGRTYLLAAVNTLDQIALQTYEVDRSPIADPETARARFIHAAPGIDAVDVTVAGGQALFPGAGFPNATDYQPLAAQSYDLEVAPAGQETAALTAPGTQIEPMMIYDLVALSQPGGQNPQLMVLTTQPVPDCVTVLGLGQPGGACVRVVHASPDAPAVDIYVGDNAQPVVTNLAFGTATEFAALPAGDQQVRITETGTAVDQAVVDQTVSLGAGRAYLIAATDVLESIGAEVDEVDLSPVTGGQARLRVNHTAPDAGTVDVRVAGGPVLVEGLEFESSSPYLMVAPGTYPVELVGEDDAVVLTQPDVQLQANMVYDVYAIGRSENQTLALLILMAQAAPEQAVAGTPEAVGTPASPVPVTTPAATVVTTPGTTPTPPMVQVTATPAAIQVTATPAVVEVTTTPAVVEVTATPAT